MRILAAVMFFFVTLSALAEISKGFGHDAMALFGLLELTLPLIIAVLVYRMSR